HGFPLEFLLYLLGALANPESHGSLVGGYARAHPADCLVAPRIGPDRSADLDGDCGIHFHRDAGTLPPLLFRDLLSILCHVLGLCGCEYLRWLHPASANPRAPDTGSGTRLDVGGFRQPRLLAASGRKRAGFRAVSFCGGLVA